MTDKNNNNNYNNDDNPINEKDSSKTPKRVRISLQENGQLDSVIFPTDEEHVGESESQQNTELPPPSMNSLPRREISSYINVPVKNNKHRRTGSRLHILRQSSDSYIQTHPFQKKNRLEENRNSLRSYVPDDTAKNGMLDIGLITSCGLAPGSGVSDRDMRSGRERDYREDLEMGKPGWLGHRVTESNASEGTQTDIPLLNLHQRFSNIFKQRDTPDNSLDASKVAENLIQVHKRGRSINKRASATHSIVPVSAYFDNELFDVERSQSNRDSKLISPGSRRTSALISDLNPIFPNPLDETGDEPDPETSIAVEGSDYVPPPLMVRQGVLGSLLQLYNKSHTRDDSGCTLVNEGPSSPISIHESSSSFTEDEKEEIRETTKITTFKCPESSKVTKTFKSILHHKSKSANNSVVSFDDIYYEAPSSPSVISSPISTTFQRSKDHLRKLPVYEALKKSATKKKKVDQEKAITIHIADVLQRQRFILRLCRALMLYGAPTHRLEEYMQMTSRALGIDGQFLYIPGCMIISFGDSSTHTSEMQLVRCVQGVNLNKLHQTHTIYKEVIHGNQRVEEASLRLEAVFSSRNLYPPWLCVLFFGFASLAVGPFAFKASWLDMPISFLVGCMVGILQIVVAPRSTLYNNVFEISASIIVSFIARAFGSIQNQSYFCYSAIAQSSLALILPGYIILCGSLELQSRNIVAGSVRMFYAIIYSMFLGFGITLGAAIYGWIDSNATSETTCPGPLDDRWKILFVPMFTIGLALVNQSHWRQIPVMVIISGAGYVATFFAGRRLANASELTSAIGAFVIGVLGNMYSRLGHGLAFAAMLPAIFVQVPSGVAAQGSLVEGIHNANNIVSNSASNSSYRNVAALGITMVQVSIGITVGLFVATLAIYPFGKKRTSLFTF